MRRCSSLRQAFWSSSQLNAGEANGPSGSVNRSGIIECVGVAVPGLWILKLRAGHKRIGAHEPPDVRRIVPNPKVIKARLAIPFFGGEFRRREDVL